MLNVCAVACGVGEILQGTARCLKRICRVFAGFYMCAVMCSASVSLCKKQHAGMKRSCQVVTAM